MTRISGNISLKRAWNYDSKHQIHQYLSFMHRFRNLYGFELKPDKLEELTQNMAGCLKNFKKSIEIFLEVLSNIVE